MDTPMTDIERRADSLAAEAPLTIRGHVREFARSVAIDLAISRGVILPQVDSESHRIVGGDVVPAGAFPSCCCIGGPAQWCCTGVLVAPTVVLTAAHCGLNITRVMVGGNKVTPPLDQDVRQIAVRTLQMHPKYGGNPNHENDITILILSSPAQVAPIRLASREQLRAASSVELVGFGYNDPQRPLGFGVKRKVTAPLGLIKLSESDDFGRLPQILGFRPDSELVAGRKGLGKDTCNGDSGGPAYISDGRGGHALAGLTSRATREATVRCGDGGIYVRPDAYLPWINEVLALFDLPALAQE